MFHVIADVAKSVTCYMLHVTCYTLHAVTCYTLHVTPPICPETSERNHSFFIRFIQVTVRGTRPTRPFLLELLIFYSNFVFFRVCANNK